MMSAAIANSEDWQSRFAASLLDADLPPPGSLYAWNKSDPEKRYAVYRNNVTVNLVDGLCDTFPVCLALVGDEFFRAMAHVFVREHPPASRILSDYGDTFGDFIERFEPAANLPYLADVARLEYARVRAYHAADARSMTMDDWSKLSPDQLGEMILAAHPSVQIMSSSHAIVSLWAAHQGAADIAAIDPSEAEDALVIRPQLDVVVLALPPGGAEFVLALVNGASLGGAAALAAEKTPAFDLTANLAIMMQSGFAMSYQLTA